MHAVRKQVISSAFAIILVATFALGAYAQQKQKEKDHEQKDDGAARAIQAIQRSIQNFTAP